MYLATQFQKYNEIAVISHKFSLTQRVLLYNFNIVVAMQQFCKDIIKEIKLLNDNLERSTLRIYIEDIIFLLVLYID